MITKFPPEVLTPEDLEEISTLNECERRQFLATKVVFFRKQGFSISKLTKMMKTSKNTIYKGIRELRTDDGLGKGRVRRQVGGRKDLLSLHPDWIDALKVVIEPHTAHITRSWNGAPLLSVKDGAERATKTTTANGLTVHMDINSKIYDIRRPIDESYKKRVAQRVLFQEQLPKWNYLIKQS